MSFFAKYSFYKHILQDRPIHNTSSSSDEHDDVVINARERILSYTSTRESTSEISFPSSQNHEIDETDNVCLIMPYY